jgi:hypothetical protein
MTAKAASVRLRSTARSAAARHPSRRCGGRASQRSPFRKRRVASDRRRKHPPTSAPPTWGR